MIRPTLAANCARVSAVIIAMEACAAAIGQVAPTAKWQVDVQPGQCRLIRLSNDPAVPSLLIQSIVGGDDVELVLKARTLPADSKRQPFRVTVSFEGDNQRFEQNAAWLSATGDSEAIDVFALEDSFISAFGRASSISLSMKSAVIGPIALPIAGKAIAALRSCEHEQLAEWGADPAQFAPGGTMPAALTHRDTWLTKQQLVSMQPASNPLAASFRISIDTEGRVDQCSRTGPAVDDNVEKIGCSAVLSKRLFAAARDAAGKPVRGAGTFQVHRFSAPSLPR